MKPIEFVVYDGDSAPNTPVMLVAEAMHNDIYINCEGEDAVVRGYFYDHEKKRMVLELSLCSADDRARRVGGGE